MSAAGTIGSAALAVKSFPAVKQEIGYYIAKYQCKTQSAIPTDEGATTATAKSAGGRLGNSATRQQNKAIGDYLQQKGWTVTGGGGQVKEEYLPPLSGKGRAGSNYIYRLKPKLLLITEWEYQKRNLSIHYQVLHVDIPKIFKLSINVF